MVGRSRHHRTLCGLLAIPGTRHYARTPVADRGMASGVRLAAVDFQRLVETLIYLSTGQPSHRLAPAKAVSPKHGVRRRTIADLSDCRLNAATDPAPRIPDRVRLRVTVTRE